MELSDEQTAAVRALAASGSGVEAVQALAGTGKTRVLGALSGCYREAGFRVVGVAPTGRAARELGEAIGAGAFTLHGLVAKLERTGGFATPTVVLFDEAREWRRRASQPACSVIPNGWSEGDRRRRSGPASLRAGRRLVPSDHS